MSEKNGGPAFPMYSEIGNLYSEGMSLRDYFAIHAPDPSVDIVKMYLEADMRRDPHNDKGLRRGANEVIAMLRYEYADSLLMERNK